MKKNQQEMLESIERIATASNENDSGQDKQVQVREHKEAMAQRKVPCKMNVTKKE